LLGQWSDTPALFHHDRVIRAAPAGRLLEDDEQREHGERRDHQQLVVVYVSDDLRLLGDDGIERGAPAAVSGFQNRAIIGSSNIRLRP